MSAINDTWEYRTETFSIESREGDFQNWSKTRKTRMSMALDEWGNDGWEVMSIICPEPSNYTTYRVFAKRRTGCTQP